MKKLIKIIIIITAITSFMVSPPGIRLALLPLALNSPINDTNPDELFILGGGYNQKRILGISTEERIAHAINFIHPDLKTIHIIDYIGINRAYYKEHVHMLLDKHRSSQKIYFHLQSNDTVDNCTIIAGILGQRGKGYIVTSPYHVLRTRMTLCLMDVHDAFVVSPDKSEVYTFTTLEQWKRNCMLVYREYPALVMDFFLLIFKQQ